MTSEHNQASSNSSQTAEDEMTHTATQFPQPADREPFAASFWDRDTHTAGIRKGTLSYFSELSSLTVKLCRLCCGPRPRHLADGRSDFGCSQHLLGCALQPIDIIVIR
jgi:hypothetical protein